MNETLAELGCTPLTAAQRDSLKEYEREMEEEAIPQMIEEVKLRQRLAAEARTRVL